MVEKKDPGTTPPSRQGAVDFTELVDTAYADPGTWYSIEVPTRVTTKTYYVGLQGAVTRKVAEYSQQGKEMFLRFLP